MKHLKQFVKGDSFRSSLHIDQEMAIRYAEASGDYNPIHLNESFARDVGLRGTILHGLCTMAILANSACTFVGTSEFLRKIKVKFNHPVYPGDDLELQGEIQVEDSQGNSPLTLKLTCHNQDKVEVLSQCQMEFDEISPDLEKECPNLTKPTALQEDIIQEAQIRAYGQATHHTIQDGNPLVASPLFCVLLAIKPFVHSVLTPEQIRDFPQNLSDAVNFKGNLPKVLHLGQEFYFARPLQAGEKVFTDGGIERSSTRKGQEFVYFVTRIRDQNQKLAVLGRWFAVSSP